MVIFHVAYQFNKSGNSGFGESRLVFHQPVGMTPNGIESIRATLMQRNPQFQSVVILNVIELEPDE